MHTLDPRPRHAARAFLTPRTKGRAVTWHDRPAKTPEPCKTGLGLESPGCAVPIAGSGFQQFQKFGQWPGVGHVFGCQTGSPRLIDSVLQYIKAIH